MFVSGDKPRLDKHENLSSMNCSQIQEYVSENGYELEKEEGLDLERSEDVQQRDGLVNPNGMVDLKFVMEYLENQCAALVILYGEKFSTVNNSVPPQSQI
jgi:hypothetical protein